ncbi:MAG: sulfurtransferase [Candidatus Hydrogenedentes bacterium]|nr:sulfurtransferase [Candidatus Hydrogenedentota bacterium]
MEAVTFVMLLIATDQLQQLQGVQVVDARPIEAYAAAHLPGALHLDPATLSEERDGVQGLLKPVETLAALLSEAGLQPARHVVVYSGMDKPDDLKNAARLFWILEYLGFPRVSVLDGGFAKWRAEGRPVEAGAPPVPPEPVPELSLTPRPELLAVREDVLAIIGTSRGTLVDMRAPEEYAGLAKKDFVLRAGHIPGACNLPATDFAVKMGSDIAPYYTLRPVTELKQAIQGDASAPVITYCNTGRDASVGYLVYRLAGIDRVAVYDGSMAEWGNHPGLSVAGHATQE